MLEFLNEELVSFSTIKYQEGDKNYTKIKVSNSNKLVEYTQSTNEEDPAEDQRIIKKSDDLRTINREILKISAPLKYIKSSFESNEDCGFIKNTPLFDLPMSVNVDSSKNKYYPRVEIRCHEKGEDHAQVYVVAFPFNGMIKPISESKQYRIYKGSIIPSARPFFFNGRKYRKVLYLIIEINKNLFNEDHKYHTETIDLELESYGLFSDRETGERKTNHEKMTVKITKNDWNMNWEYEIINDAIIMDTKVTGEKLWVTYDRSAQPQKSPNPTTPQRRGKNNRNNGYTIEGDMMVTTNKNGIRKEIPINKKKKYNNSGNRGKRNDYNYRDYNSRTHAEDGYEGKYIDDMMERSGMFDQSSNRGKKNSRGKKKYDKSNRYY